MVLPGKFGAESVRRLLVQEIRKPSAPRTTGVVNPKARTIKIKCTDNQKQLMLATIMYMTDSDDYTPHPGWDFDTSLPTWLMKPTNNPKFGSDSNMITGQLWKYVTERKVFTCPADLKEA